jgi:RNA polymerase sigma-70 factor (ECF subfamily)
MACDSATLSEAWLALSGDAALGRRQKLAYARPMSTLPDDSALMLRYREGDLAAFEMLYRRHNDALYRYLLRLSLCTAVAEDVFQETWIKIIGARDTYRPTAKFTTFLFRVGHNCFIDYVRRNRRHVAGESADPALCEDPARTPEQLIADDLRIRKLYACLREIPEEQRDVFLLYEEGGLTVDEIALTTGVNRETAKSRLRYAVSKLKSALAETTPDAAGDLP